MGIWLQSLHNIIVALLRKYETRSFKKCKQPFRESRLCCIRLDAFRLRCISTILLVHNRHADWYVHLQQHVITGLMCQLLCGVLLGARNSRSLKYYFESARVSWLTPYLILNIILNTKLSLVCECNCFPAHMQSWLRLSFHSRQKDHDSQLLRASFSSSFAILMFVYQCFITLIFPCLL